MFYFRVLIISSLALLLKTSTEVEFNNKDCASI